MNKKNNNYLDRVFRIQQELHDLDITIRAELEPKIRAGEFNEETMLTTVILTMVSTSSNALEEMEDLR